MIFSFKRLMFALSLFVPGVTLAAYPTIERSDVKSCIKEVSALHKVEIKYIRNEATHYCTKGVKSFDVNYCTEMKEWERESSSKNDVAWFIEGKEGCGEGFACYGIKMFNDNPNQDFIVNNLVKGEAEVFDEVQARTDYHKSFDERNKKYNVSAADARYYEEQDVLGRKSSILSSAASRCLAKIWYAKLKDGKYTAGNAGPTTQTPTSQQAKQTHTQKKNNAKSESDKIAQKKPAPSIKGKPRQHVKEAVATKCLSLLKDSLYGGFKNSCNFPVEYTYCAYKPKKDSWTEAFDCEKDKFGSDMIEANGIDEAHTKGAQQIHWGACRSEKDYPITPFGKWDASKRRFQLTCREWVYREGNK